MKFDLLKECIENAHIHHTPLNEIADIDRYQVRRISTNTEHYRLIAERIIDKNRDTSNMEPIIVLENYGPDNKHRMLDGTHRYLAAVKAGAITYPVKYINKSCYSQYTPLQLMQFGMYLNKIPDEPKLPINNQDVEKFLLEYFQHHKTLDNAKEILIDQFGLAKSEANKRVNRTQWAIDQDSYLGPDQMWIIWNAEDRKEQLKEEVRKRETKDTAVYCSSSGHINYEKLIKFCIDQNKKSIIMLLYHPSLMYEMSWREKWQAKHVRYVRWMLSPRGISVHWDILKCYEQNTLVA